MWKEISKILITSILSGTVAYWLAYTTFSRQIDVDEKHRLDESLNRILDVNMQYPYFEDSIFISRWNKGDVTNSDSSIRYQNYCLYVFNFAEAVLYYYDLDVRETEKFYDVQELLIPHKGWWKIPPPKPSEYDPNVKTIIDGFMK